MQKAYSRRTWKNDSPPALNDTNLNKDATAIDLIDDRVIELFNRTQNLEGYQVEAQEAVDEANAIAAQMRSDAQTARNQMAHDATGYINQSKSWAIGEGDPQRTDQATNNSKYFAEQAEQVAIANGYVHFVIDDRGHLIYIKTTNVDDLDFEIRNGTNLFAVINDGI